MKIYIYFRGNFNNMCISNRNRMKVAQKITVHDQEFQDVSLKSVIPTIFNHMFSPRRVCFYTR